jgi:hypothetical protein
MKWSLLKINSKKSNNFKNNKLLEHNYEQKALHYFRWQDLAQYS